MRLLSAVAVTCLFLNVTSAQTGLARHGVFLQGTPGSPLIVNQSSHRILAYTLLFVHANGATTPSLQVMLGQLRNQPLTSVGIAPMTTYTHRSSAEVRDPNGALPTEQALSVVLDSVLFDDGTLVGPDEAGSFYPLTARIQAEKDAHAVLLHADGAASAWATLASFASGKTLPPVDAGQPLAYQHRYQALFQIYAEELLHVRSKGGESAALRLAHSSAFYPVIVREK